MGKRLCKISIRYPYADGTTISHNQSNPLLPFCLNTKASNTAMMRYMITWANLSSLGKNLYVDGSYTGNKDIAVTVIVQAAKAIIAFNYQNKLAA